VLYVLDEPSIGLHQRDNDRLLTTLKNLRDQGNTVIVVEHDEEAIREADYVFDIGPGAGVHGGAGRGHGTPAEIAADPASVTGQYLSGAREIAMPAERRKGNGKRQGGQGRGQQPQGVTAEFPLGKFVCVTGVSGGGKSTLTIETLFKTASMRLNGARQTPRPARRSRGSSISTRSSTSTSAPSGARRARTPPPIPAPSRPIRDWFAGLPEAKARGYKPGRFLQRQGRALRGVPGRRRHQDRDALPAGCLRHLRDLQGQALQPRDAGDQFKGKSSPTCST
jgi:excinuclease ABC subunit A